MIGGDPTYSPISNGAGFTFYLIAYFRIIIVFIIIKAFI